MTRPIRAAILAVLLAVTGGSAEAAAPRRGLAAEPFVAEALGLRMYLPADAIADAQVVDEAVSYVVSNPQTTWSMRISAVTPAVAGPTAAALAEEHLKAVEATGRRLDILTNEARTVGSVTGQMLYVQQTLDDQKPLVSGWLFLPTSARSFVVLTVLTTAEGFARLRPVFDASFATIELRSLEELERQRKARYERARAIVVTFSPDKLRSLLGQKQWYRIYRPSASGRVADDTEVGFLSMQCQEGMRGELTPERSTETFGSMEAETGLMVSVEARAIISAEKNHYLDVNGRYWMDWDRTEEAWSVRQTQRIGAHTQTSAETGVRNKATLDVIHSSREQLTREPSRWTIPDLAYLSQPEVFLLGRLLPRDGSLDGDLAFYFYDTRSRRLAERVDQWQRTRDGSGDWLLTSTPMLEAAMIRQRFDARGDRIQRIDGDGTLTERIDPDDLARLWKSKGLMAR